MNRCENTIKEYKYENAIKEYKRIIPRTFLTTADTSDTTNYDTVLDIQINPLAKGINYFNLSIDPDANALYNIFIAKVLVVRDLEITAIWSLTLPHIQDMLYDGFNPGDHIIVQHIATSLTPITTGATLVFNEVI